jgi:hypothetical protein
VEQPQALSTRYSTSLNLPSDRRPLSVCHAAVTERQCAVGVRAGVSGVCVAPSTETAEGRRRVAQSCSCPADGSHRSYHPRTSPPWPSWWWAPVMHTHTRDGKNWSQSATVSASVRISTCMLWHNASVVQLASYGRPLLARTSQCSLMQRAQVMHCSMSYWAHRGEHG